MTQPNTARLLREAADKMELSLYDERLFQIFVHQPDNHLYVGPHSTYDGYKQDAIAFGWDDGLLIRILPCYCSPDPSNIQDYIVDKNTLQELLDFMEKTPQAEHVKDEATGAVTVDLAGLHKDTFWHEISNQRAELSLHYTLDYNALSIHRKTNKRGCRAKH